MEDLVHPLWYLRCVFYMQGFFWALLLVAAVGLLRRQYPVSYAWIVVLGCLFVLAQLIWNAPAFLAQRSQELKGASLNAYFVGAWGTIMAVVGMFLALLSGPRPSRE